ncbi:MAG: HEAT repeat domain-containing protein [Bacteroidales bacterium]|jgi:hypothetical protein|nr:HEAT repeat domain-containing protein [Bacteroidales bacterium]
MKDQKEPAVSIADIEKIFDSNNQELIVQSLELISEIGNEQIFELLVRQLLKHKNYAIQQAISACLVDVKNPRCAEILRLYIENPENTAQKALLFSIAWQSALDFSVMSDFVVASICNDLFEIAFEAHTLLEQIADTLASEKKQMYIQQLNAALLQHNNSNTQKEFLLNDSIEILQEKN